MRGKCEAVRLWRPYIRVAATLVRLSGRLHEAERGRIGWPWGDDEAARAEWERDSRFCCIKPPSGAALTSAKPKLGAQRGRDAGRSIHVARRTRSGSERACFRALRTISEMIEPWLRWADVRLG